MGAEWARQRLEDSQTVEGQNQRKLGRGGQSRRGGGGLCILIFNNWKNQLSDVCPDVVDI